MVPFFIFSCFRHRPKTFKKGESIEVIRGPLQGIIATSIDEGRTHKLIVEIESMEQRFIVHVPKSCVRKVNV